MSNSSIPTDVLIKYLKDNLENVKRAEGILFEVKKSKDGKFLTVILRSVIEKIPLEQEQSKMPKGEPEIKIQAQANNQKPNTITVQRSIVRSEVLRAERDKLKKLMQNAMNDQKGTIKDSKDFETGFTIPTKMLEIQYSQNNEFHFLLESRDKRDIEGPR